MSKEAYYFSHDANARHDPKILAMRSEFGIEGYGVYWVVVEMLREQDEFKLNKKDYIWNAIAMQVQSNAYTKDHAKRFVETCINEYELFEDDDTHFWSNSLLKRMDKKNELSEKRRAAANKRWDKPNDTNDEEKTDDANAMQVDANAMQTDARKGNERKGNKKEIDINSVNLFEQFWNKYPKKVGLAKAKKKFPKLLETHGFDVIMKGLEGYLSEIKKNKTEKQFIKNGDTFLNQESFLDFLQTETTKPDEEGEYSPYKDWGIF